jgi:hypothetical protein
MGKVNNSIGVEEFMGWLHDNEEIYASLSREGKRLISNMYGVLKVTVAGVTIWTGHSPVEAVEQFNAITKKYVQPKI